MGMFDDLLEQKQMNRQAGMIPGIITGIVKENWNEKHKGQVKVEYNLGEQGKNLTGWVPVMTPYGGAEFGIYLLPEVGSEVVLGFILGDRNCPVVLGNIWSDKTPQPKEAPAKGNTKKQLLTKGGAQLLASEEKGKEELLIQLLEELSLSMNAEKGLIQIGDKDRKNMIELDVRQGKVTVKAEKAVEIQAGTNVSLKLDKSGGSLDISADKITETAKQSIQMKGNSAVKLEGGTSAEVSTNGQMTIKGGGTVKLSGALVQLN